MFKKMDLEFHVGWGAVRTPTDSGCWGSLPSPRPTQNNYLKHNAVSLRLPSLREGQGEGTDEKEVLWKYQPQAKPQ